MRIVVLLNFNAGVTQRLECHLAKVDVAPSFDGASRRMAGRGQSMHYVYFLYLSNGDIYKGYTENVQSRLSRHQAGAVESTKHYRPVKLIGYEYYQLKSDALRREKFLKTSEGLKFLRQQYKDILTSFKRE